MRVRPADPRPFLARLRRRAAAAALVGFGAFFGLAAVNVVGVTAHTTPQARPVAGRPSVTAAPTLAPGDFFGAPGGSGAGSGSGQAFAPVLQPPLIAGGGGPMLSSGGS
ncbi:MAG: hypothetical protein ACHQ15_07305 [Candidatus Limnocylindrales bacterium]